MRKDDAKECSIKEHSKFFNMAILMNDSGEKFVYDKNVFGFDNSDSEITFKEGFNYIHNGYIYGRASNGSVLNRLAES
jgi:hypothetical protein